MKNMRFVLLVLSMLMLFSCDRKPDLAYLDACVHPNALKEIKYYVKHNISDAKGLLIAAEKNTNEKIVKELLKSKNIKEENKFAALWMSLDNDNSEIFKLLLKETKGVNSCDGFTGMTILMKACYNGKTDIVKHLIKKGADINAKTSEGYNAFVFAYFSEKRNIDILKMLINAGSDVNVADADGKTPLIEACISGDLGMINLLLKAGADVNVKEENGMTPLMFACANGNVQIIDTLLAAGADINAKSNIGGDALSCAVLKGDKDVINVLLKAGADVNGKGFDGSTILMGACEFNNLDLVNLFIEAKADVNAQDENGKTALMIACEKGNKDIVNTLLAAGANVKIKNKNDATAYSIVYVGTPQNKEIIDVLLAAGADFKEVYEYYGIKMVPIPGKKIEMLSTEVTQKLYKEIMGKNPSQYKGDNLPVESVSWYDAVRFCNALSQKLGLSPVYKDSQIYENEIEQDLYADGFRLPTESEWEYAAKGGEDCTYAGSNNIDEVAWYRGNSNGKSHPVGEKKPNGYGLYDMSGNADEWCWDYGPDPTIFNNGRRLRGGSWEETANYMKIIDRNSYYAGGSWSGKDTYGFRIVRNIE